MYLLHLPIIIEMTTTNYLLYKIFFIAVHRGLIGDIIKRFEQKGFKLVAMKMMHVSF